MGRKLAQRKIAIAAAAFIAAFAAVLALGQPQPSGPPPLPPSQPAEPLSSDPLELFTVMMPVFTHDRCANCHGGVDPHDASGATHDGGVIPAGGTCSDSGCHTQTDDSRIDTRWHTASTLHSFGGRTAKELCDMQSGVADDFNSRARDGYYQHLDTDFLIDLAFIGLSGGASSTEAAPPMRKDDFLKAGRAWLKLGAKCNHWKGSITQHETFASSYSYLQGGEGSPVRVTVTENAQRILAVDRADGVSTYRINQGETSTS